MNVERLVDGAIGEAREALLSEGRAFALRLMRASDAGVRARWGEIYVARVGEVDQRRRGAFLDLGLQSEQGFLPLDAGGRAMLAGKERAPLRVGQGVVAEIVREGARRKGPVLRLLELGHDGERPHRIAQPECDTDLEAARPASSETRARLDAIVEEALARTAPIPGGGVLIIEPTSALAAIDVDAGARAGAQDPERFALDLNLAAAAEAARQIRVRNLAGLIAIDFVALRAKGHRARLEAGVRQRFAEDPWSVQFGTLSRFGLFELSRAQLRRPLHEQMREGDGRLTCESVALACLRAIEREALTARGRVVVCTVAGDVAAWLEDAAFPWRAALSERIGVRWRLEGAPAPWPRDKIDVRAP